MSDILKVLGNEVTLASDAANVALSSVGSAVLVRLFNTSTNAIITCTLQNSANANVASFSLGYIGADENVVYIRKETTDKLIVSANSVVKAVKVGYY